MNTDLPWSNVARFLKRATVILIALAIVLLVMAILAPDSHSHHLTFGLIALVLAFLSALWRIFFLKLPIHSRSGAIMTVESHPMSYRVAFLAGSLFGGFLLYILIHSYLSAH